MIDDDYQPSGDIRKDYMAFSELCNRNTTMDIINNIHYILVKTPPNYDDYYLDDDTHKVEAKRILIDDFNDLDADEISLIQGEINARNPFYRFTYVDILSLSKAIAFFSLNFISLSLVNCGLSRKSLCLLGKALSHKRTLRFLRIDMNPFIESFNADDEYLSTLQQVKNLESTLFFCTPSFLQKKNEETQETQQLVIRKVKGKKKNEQLADEQENIQKKIEEHIIRNTYLTSSLGALFLTSAKHISLRGCNLNDEDAEAIAEILSENNELLSLNLWGNLITDRGGIAIAKALKTNRVIRSISLAMNKISDRTVEEICKSLCRSHVYTEDEFFKLREKAYKSTFGTLNIPREYNNNFSILLPPLPIHLRPVSERKKVEKQKKTASKKTTTDSGEEIIEWELNCQRFDEEETPKKNASRVGSRSSSKPMKQELEQYESNEIQKPLFQIPGNESLRSINLSANKSITDTGASLFLKLPYIPLERLNLSNCNVSNEMFYNVSRKMNESPPSSTNNQEEKQSIV